MSQNELENEMKDWLENIKGPSIKQSTYHVYSYRIKKYINPFFREMKVESICSKTIQTFISGLKNEETLEVLAPQTIKGIVNLLNIFFKNQVLRGKIKTNPCKNIVLPKIDLQKIAVLDTSERVKLINFLLKEDSPRSKLVIIGLFTGMRIGELCALTWDNVDLKSKKLFVNVTSQRVSSGENNRKTMVILGSPKTRSSKREIPTSKFVAKIIKSLYVTRQYLSNFVFCKKDGTGYDIRGIQKYFRKVMKQLGILNKSFHCIRHTFATQAIEAGVDAKILSIILGHSNVITTLSLYVHPNEKYIRSRLEKVSQHLSKNIE